MGGRVEGKVMKKTHGAVIVLVLVLSFFGCTSEKREPQTSSSTGEDVAIVVKDNKGEMAEAEWDKAHAKSREQRLVEMRVRDIAVAKEAVAHFRGNDDWITVVKGGTAGPSAGLCSQIEKLLDLHSTVFERLDAQEPYRGSIGWPEIGVERANLWKEFQTASKKAAVALFAVYKRSPGKRSVDCGKGEGSWRLDEPGEVMQRLLWIMEHAELTPVNLGTTAEAMRATIVNDYRAYITMQREMVARGEASKSDGGGAIVAAVRDAEQLWGISKSQLGLTAWEKQKIE